MKKIKTGSIPASEITYGVDIETTPIINKKKF